MAELSKLPNIGKKVEEQLLQVGINSADELMRIGAKAAWLKIQEIDESACINRLMALEGVFQYLEKPNRNGLKNMLGRAGRRRAYCALLRFR